MPGVKKEIGQIITCFPSSLKIIEENRIYVEGGMVLLRLDKKSIKDENVMKFEINYYNELENKKESTDIEYSFKKEIIEKEYYSDAKIETALALYYFGKFNRRYMKICNNENKKKKYDKEYIKRKEFKIEKDKIKKYMKEHLDEKKSDKLNETIVNDYIEKMDKFVDKAIQYCNDNNKNKKINNFLNGNNKSVLNKGFL